MPEQPNRWFVGHIHCSDKLVRVGPDHTTRFPNYVTLREYTQTPNEYEQWRYLLNPCRIRFGLMLIELCVQLAANGDFKLKLIPTTRLVCTARCWIVCFTKIIPPMIDDEIIASWIKNRSYFDLNTNNFNLNLKLKSYCASLDYHTRY